jgi:hypothetical protein
MVHCSKFVVLFQKVLLVYYRRQSLLAHRAVDDTRQIHLLSVLERSFLLIEWYRTTLSQM